MPRSIPIFEFAHLSPKVQLSLASHMTSKALLDYALECLPFRNFLVANIGTVVLACLLTQYGYILELRSLTEIPPIQLNLHNAEKSALLESIPLLMFLMHEENLWELPEHRGILMLLSTSPCDPWTPVPPLSLENTYGTGIRGLLRYLFRYKMLCRAMTSTQRRRRMQQFLERHYTAWAVRDIADVYEALRGVIARRLGWIQGPELEDVAAYLIADLRVLQMPQTGAHQWLAQLEREKGGRTEHSGFFWGPVVGALKSADDLAAGEYEGWETGFATAVTEPVVEASIGEDDVDTDDGVRVVCCVPWLGRAVNRKAAPVTLRRQQKVF
ncbi:hypothetical protein BZA05DRAFT_471471 [Tricharina praecox]|uniref:uncharacterized protein n=1 Tax=Tricharina praecox TaxID=43433 RepID=UPI0022208449|nr:uncharacterized protein BZA05DRAFT_471471 [Tricharina praecox]KAI5856389.1 hypothetical protein BZA05DRAFT_471471 [Tricharina praecox]